jgi:type 1 fimbria pilin
MFKEKVVALALMLMLATSVFAGDVDDCASDAGMMTWDGTTMMGALAATPCPAMQITICPAADFEFIRTACGSTNDYIWVTAKTLAGVAIPGIPWTDYWMNACDPTKQLCLCAAPIVADSLTGANGKTTFSGRIAGGGCTLSQGIWIAIQGKTISSKPCPPHNPLCLNVVIKSPDLVGGPLQTPDCKVTVSDLVPFSKSYNTQQGVPPPPGKAFNACCDYNDDLKCNLTDFAFLGAHYTHKCQ